MKTRTRTNPNPRRKTKTKSRFGARRPRSSGSRKSRRIGSSCASGWGGRQAVRITRRIRSSASSCRRRSVRRLPSAVRPMTRIRSKSSSSRCSTPRWGAVTSWSRRVVTLPRSSTKPAGCATARPPRPSNAPRRRRATRRRRRRSEQARLYLDRVIDLPDPDDELLKYLPTRSPEGEERGVSQQKAEALCRRLVATHCLYGVDKNPLAVELAKLAIWLESHAEGMPLTFLDHRLVVGDSLTGPFWDKLLFSPSDPKSPVKDLFSQGIYTKLRAGLTAALVTCSAVGGVDRLESRGVDRQGSDQSPARSRLASVQGRGRGVGRRRHARPRRLR